MVALAVGVETVQVGYGFKFAKSNYGQICETSFRLQREGSALEVLCLTYMTKIKETKSHSDL